MVVLHHMTLYYLTTQFILYNNAITLYVLWAGGLLLQMNIRIRIRIRSKSHYKNKNCYYWKICDVYELTGHNT